MVYEIRNISIIAFVFISFILGGCNNQKYATLYIKTVDEKSGTTISASAISACDGLSLGDSLMPIKLTNGSYWTKGKHLSVIVYANGYSPNWQMAKLEKWYNNKIDADLNANTIIIHMIPSK